MFSGGLDLTPMELGILLNESIRQNQLLMLRVFKGEDVAEKIAVLLGVEQQWLEAGFEEIDETWGSFDNYVSNGLQLSAADIQRLRDILLE